MVDRIKETRDFARMTEEEQAKELVWRAWYAAGPKEYQRALREGRIEHTPVCPRVRWARG